ncbi:MAG: hypothetical protein LH645_14315 [Actinomycetia bacterium]|nr:hypothetical protein [Actinomycetes bacterium]
MRVAGIPLNRPWLTWLGLVLLIFVQGVGFAWVRAPEWLGWAPSTAGAVETVTIFGLSVVCLVATWLASLPRTFQYQDTITLASRRPYCYRLLVMAYVGSAGIVGFAGCALALIALPWALGGSLSGPPLTLVLSTAATLASALAWTSLGIVMAKIRPVFIALAVAAVAPYAWYAVGSYLYGGPWQSFFLVDLRGFDYFTPDPTGWAARAAFWLAIATVLAASVLHWKRTTTVSLWVTSLSAALVLLAGTALVPTSGADAAECLDGEPIVCTTLPYAFALPSYSAAAHEAVMALPPGVRPTVIAQEANVVGAVPDGALIMLLQPSSGFTQPATLVDRELFLSDFGEKLFGKTGCFDQSDTEQRTVSDALQIWWRERFDIPLDGSSSIGSTPFDLPEFEAARAAAAEFANLDPQVRDAWLTEHSRDITACRDLPTELP